MLSKNFLISAFICMLLILEMNAFMPDFIIKIRRPIITKLAAKKHQVKIQHLGTETVLSIPENVSILSAALDAGISLPHDCNLGVCLTCPSKVVSGLVDQSEGTLDDSVTSQGFALTCITYPRSDCVIRSIEEDELVSAQFSR